MFAADRTPDEGAAGAAEDTDSSYGDEMASSTASLSESILQYRELHGRTYHKYGTSTYVAPNDDHQNEVLDISYHMLTMMLDNKLFLAPIDPNPQQVLDIGTGTGIWVIDFADEFPSATVTGTDLSPIQPQWAPPNVKFEIDDAHLEWTWPENHFDFIHIRCLMGSIKSWPTLYEQAFHCLKPGGFIEHLEFDIQFMSDDGTVKPGDTMYDWSEMFIKAGEDMGQTFKIGERSRQLLENSGFEGLVDTKYKIPVGSWMTDPRWKEIGRWNRFFLLEGLDGTQLFILKTILGWDYDDIQDLGAKMRAALTDKNNHAYYVATLVYGQKPR